MAKKNKAVFLDRDGTLIKERNYLNKIRDISFFVSTLPALKLLQSAGFKLIITSNQSGVARGYLTEKKLKAINLRIEKKLKSEGIEITATYYCPHLPEDNCDCRKPKTKMIFDAQKKYKLDLSKSYVIGDKLTDIKFGQNAGVKTILLLTGYGRKEWRIKSEADGSIKPDFVARNILDAANWIVKQR